MSILHYGAPYLPTTRPESLWGRTKHTWTGWDGSVWDLSDPAGGVFLTRGGVRGLGMPNHSPYTAESPAVAGGRHLGSRIATRECFWPLLVFSDVSSAGWVELDRAFWRSLHRDKPGVWRVETPLSTRELSCRYLESDDGYEMDPMEFGWATYGVRLVANDPFWRSGWVHRTFASDVAPTSFFGAGAPSFTIGQSSQMATATIGNEGDEPSFLVYILDGPFDSATVGIGDPGATTEYLSPVLEGQSVVIDTRPSTPATARLIDTPTAAPGTLEWESQVFDPIGVSAFAGLGRIALNSPLQSGQERPINLSMVGNGSVTVAHRPGFNKAW